MWNKGDILIDEEKIVLVEYKGFGIYADTFEGMVIKSLKYKEYRVFNDWSKDCFILATKENTPKEWHKYLKEEGK